MTNSQPWLSVTNGSGYLAGHGTTQVTVSLNSQADALSDGRYTDAVDFINTTDHTGDTTRGVVLEVGIPTVVHEWTLNSNPGWTTQGDWAYGQPTGGGGEYGGPDPTSGHTGTNVYGYNLAGDYPNDMAATHLTSPAIDCTGYSAVHLKFWRWLGVEQRVYDRAFVLASNDGANWTTVWENIAEVTDTSWTPMDLDIAEVADNQPTVFLRWTMGDTDGGWRYCGWNIDDIQIEAIGGEQPPLSILFPYGLPEHLAPGERVTVTVQIVNGAQVYVPGTGTMHYRYDNGAFRTTPLVHTSGNFYEAALPPADCAADPEYYFSAQGNGGATVFNPQDAPTGVLTADVGAYFAALDDDFETDQGWTVVAGATAGNWERVNPQEQKTNQLPREVCQPEDDHTTGGTRCYVTDGGSGSYADDYDVEGGPTRLVSPPLPLEGTDATVSYWRWYHLSGTYDDELTVEVSNNGTSWTPVETVSTRREWTQREWPVNDYVVPTDNVQVRFSVSDSSNNSIVEALIDDFNVTAFGCTTPAGDGDLDYDTDVDLVDFAAFQQCFDRQGPLYDCQPGDMDASGQVDEDDFALFSAALGDPG